MSDTKKNKGGYWQSKKESLRGICKEGYIDQHREDMKEREEKEGKEVLRLMLVV